MINRPSVVDRESWRGARVGVGGRRRRDQHGGDRRLLGGCLPRPGRRSHGLLQSATGPAPASPPQATRR